MSLKEYQKKRDFSRTSEPKASQKITKSKSQKGSGRFVIQEHDARSLHYDLRLEIDGVLKSWAVPKEPPKVAGIKRLAMQTEDHPIDYINFEGVIPSGQYGAGRVKIWDKGKFKLNKDSAKNPKDGNLVFILAGDKMKGRYVLINTSNKKWLFFKTKED